MNCVYYAIATQKMPIISGFGNGVDKLGSRYVTEMIKQYPVLKEVLPQVRKLSKGTAYELYNEYVYGKQQ